MVDSVLLTLASKLMDRTKLPKIDPDYIKSTMVENTFKPLRKLFSMTDVYQDTSESYGFAP